MRHHQSESFQKMKEGNDFFVDSFLQKKQIRCYKLVRLINFLSFKSKLRNSLFKLLFSSYGNNNIIKNGFSCNYGFNISIGSNCYFNFNLTILDTYKVTIGSNVFIGPNVVISPVTHPKNPKTRLCLTGKQIVIEDDVWIGAGAIILPGVTLKKGSIIGAGSVVNKDTYEFEIVAGVPARQIGEVKNDVK